MIAPVEEDKGIYSSCEESSEEEEYISTNQNNNLVEILSTSGEEATFSPPKKFQPGQFSCDVVYTKRFPLHWRIAPNAAYNKLMSDALTPFLVKNKPGMFVCSHDDAVVYCFLSEVSTVSQSSTLSDSMNQSLLSVNNNGEDGYYITNPESPYGTPLITTNDTDTLGLSHSKMRYPTYIQNKPSPQSSITSERQQFSPRQSPSLTDAGVSAISPTTGRRLGARFHEGRELVLDVHGVGIDYYIIDGLVDMIESRITSEITLKEVQQFLVRNPNSKLSRADIDFILPVNKEPLVHKKVSIPSFIEDTVQFLKIFRKNILTGSSMHAIQSNYLPAVVKQNHDLRYSVYDFNTIGLSKQLEESNYYRSATDEWSALDLSFYYNYLNRAPGTLLPFEQKIGEGVCGVCISVLNSDDVAYSKISSNNISIDYDKLNINVLQSCLESDFEQTDNANTLKIAVDIWSHCKVDTEQLYTYLFKSFRQSICDYIIENIISSIALSKKSRNKFKSIAKLLIFTLKKALSWESSTVRQSTQQIQLAPWYFDGIALQLRSDLVDIHPSLHPVIARAMLSSDLFSDSQSNDIENEDYKLYVPGSNSNGVETETDKNMLRQLSTQSKLAKRKAQYAEDLIVSKGKQTITEVPTFDNKNYRYLVISGLPELQSKYGLHSRRSSSELGTPLLSNRAKFGLSPYVGPINEDEPGIAKNDNMKRDDSISLHSRQESLASSISKTLSSYISKQKQNDLKETPHQRSFLMFQLDSSQLTLFSYNCSDSFVDHVYNTTLKSIFQQETRHLGLNNILNQKLGLFHHSKTMANILTGTCDVVEQHMNSPSGVAHPTPLQHNVLAQVQYTNNNTRTPISPNLANTIGRLAQLDSSSSVPSLDSSNGDRRTSTMNNQITVDFESLQHLVTNNFEFKYRQYRQHKNGNDKAYQSTSVLEICTNAKLCKTHTSDQLLTAIRGADANTVLRDIYAESIEHNENRYDKDYLIRHGEPYLEMYLSRSKIITAHEKAFKVYAKWADEYYGPGHSTTTDEMMTVNELKQILKASRLLHFCRTPLIFSGSNVSVPSDIQSSSLIGNGFEKLFNKSILSRTEDMTAWYERLSRGFMKEYASYLESIGMHLIVYGPSNDHPDEIEAYLSKFTITEDYSVDSPIVYLLQVFEGGSIMCEVRLTGAFVSVTLYTLHRRYGRLQNSLFSARRRDENIGRKNFQDFMGECDRFKQRIHVNSFVFDFHLRYIQRSLDDVELLPTNLNLLSIIKNTVATYDRPAIYSRNRIINGIYEYSVEESLSTLIPWVMNNGSSLGMKTLCVDKVPVACFVSSDDLSFNYNSPSTNNSLFRYTLVICPAEKTSSHRWRDSISVHRQGSFDMMGTNSAQKIVNHLTKSSLEEGYTASAISFQYYILVTYRGMDRCTTSSNCQKAWSKVLKDKPKRYANFLDEVLAPESFTMGDVFESAKKKMNCIVDKVNECNCVLTESMSKQTLSIGSIPL